jgi:hypothetical protein
MLVFGAGLGFNMQSIVLAMQNAVEPRDMGVATSAVTFFRQVGGSLGTAIFLSILFSTAGNKIVAAYADARTDPAFKQAAAAHPEQLAQLHGSSNLNDTAFVQNLDPILAHPFKTGFSNAMDLVFLVGAIVLLIAVVLSLMLKEVPLRSMSGQQARVAAEAADTGGPVDVPGGAAAVSVPADLSRQAGPSHLAPGEASEDPATAGRHRDR